MKITELFERGEFVVSAEVDRQKDFMWSICWRRPKRILAELPQ